MPHDIADAVTRQAGQPGARLRVGTVLAVTSAQVTVRLADATIGRAMWCDHVTGLRSGDVVALLHDGPVLLIIGRPTGTGQSLIVNGGFEQVDTAGGPSNWRTYQETGAAQVGMAGAGGYEGQHALSVTGSGTDTYVYSVAVPVAAGQTWQLTAHVSGAYSGRPVTAQAVLGAIWFDTASGTYPDNRTQPDTLAANVTAVREGEWTTMDGQVTVPASGTSYMCVYLETLTPTSDTATLLWDAVDARQL